MTPQVHAAFPHTWNAQILAAPPLIAPARQFTYPLYVPGEDDAMARGAMLVSIQPERGGQFLATCALGFREASMPSGLYACPNADDLLAVAGGYAYLINTLDPTHCLHIPLKPVTALFAAPEEKLLLLAGFTQIVAINKDGIAWTSGRLSWEGITLGEAVGGVLHGSGWNMQSDRDIPFVLDLSTGKHTGGGFPR